MTTQVRTDILNPDRRQLLSQAAMGAVAASVSSLLPLQPARAATNGTIRPFHVNVPEADLLDLRRRLAASRWPDREIVTDQSQGVQLKTVQELVRYWQSDYDWRKIEARLNALPQFVTDIDGVDIHFIHVRSRHENALPMIVTHGWPGSIIEQMKIVGPLTDPTAHGASATDAFDLVIPSLPGHGFSGKPTELGWDPQRIARAWIVLMKRLGYSRYVAQGGDWGNAVTEQMALIAPPELLGIHTNMPATVPDDIAKALQPGGMRPPDLSTDERIAYDQLDDFYKHGLGYAIEMSNRPQTLLWPRGFAGGSRLLDARPRRTQCRNDRARFRRQDRRSVTGRCDRQHHALLAHQHRGVVGAALLGEQARVLRAQARQDTGRRERLSDEIYAAPRSWAEKAYPKLIHYSRLDKGGHFAAWEQPALFCAEMRTAFRPLRQSI